MNDIKVKIETYHTLGGYRVKEVTYDRDLEEKLEMYQRLVMESPTPRILRAISDLRNEGILTEDDMLTVTQQDPANGSLKTCYSFTVTCRYTEHQYQPSKGTVSITNDTISFLLDGVAISTVSIFVSDWLNIIRRLFVDFRYYQKPDESM